MCCLIFVFITRCPELIMSWLKDRPENQCSTQQNEENRCSCCVCVYFWPKMCHTQAKATVVLVCAGALMHLAHCTANAQFTKLRHKSVTPWYYQTNRKNGQKTHETKHSVRGKTNTRTKQTKNKTKTAERKNNKSICRNWYLMTQSHTLRLRIKCNQTHSALNSNEIVMRSITFQTTTVSKQRTLDEQSKNFQFLLLRCEFFGWIWVLYKKDKILWNEKWKKFR